MATEIISHSVTEKYCSGCNSTKSATVFWKNKNAKDGLGFYCIPCRTKRKRLEHLRTYELTRATYKELLDQQHGGCGICGKPFELTWKGRAYALCVDHDHSTGAIRGILCITCNTALGMFGDNLEGILRVVRYLSRT